MPNELTWSDRASDEYEKLLDYLSEEWGKEITKRVGIEIEQKITHIQNNPEHYPIAIQRSEIRRCVASPQTSIYFKITSREIRIMSLFDNRQNPKKRKL